MNIPLLLIVSHKRTFFGSFLWEMFVTSQIVTFLGDVRYRIIAVGKQVRVVVHDHNHVAPRREDILNEHLLPLLVLLTRRADS